MASEVSWRTEDLGRALDLAKRAADSAKTVDDYLWLGQLLMLMHKTPEAEQAFRSAIQAAPQELRAWQALVQLQVRQNSAEPIERTLQDAAGKLPPERIAMIRAQALTELNKPEQAAAEYDRALQLKPDDSKILLSAAAFFVGRHDLARSESLLQKLIDPALECTPDERTVARRQLALVLANARQYPKVQEALRLIEQNEKESPAPTPEDQRVKAVVTAALPGQEAREQAISMLQQLAETENPQAGDHFLLAQLYEGEGRWPDARHELQRLIVSVAETPPIFLAAYIRALLDHNELHEAKLWLTRWQNLHPDESDTAEFQAEVDVADKKFDHAVEVITKQTQRPNTPSGKPWAADYLDRLAFGCQDPEGAKILKEAAERAFAMPQSRRPAKPWRCRISSPAKAGLPRRSICVWTTPQSRRIKPAKHYCLPSERYASRKLLPPIGRESNKMVRQRFDEDNHQPHLATAIGTLYESQTRYGDAVNAYRQAIELDPNDIVALNNIALLLAHQGNTQQANGYLKQALQIAGPRSDLLDSRGTVRLAMGDTDGAIADFTSAIADKASPSRWLHLAAAQLHAHHNDEAQKAFDQALTLGLNPKQVHPFDQSDYGILNNQFGHK